jgi:hypothetical protein
VRTGAAIATTRINAAIASATTNVSPIDWTPFLLVLEFMAFFPGGIVVFAEQ